MIYTLNNSSIFITDNESVNYIQEKNPVTQEYFKDKESSIAWGEEFVKNYLGTTSIDISFNIIDGIMTFESETKLNCIVKVELFNSTDVLELEFVEGIAQKEVSLEKGEYELYFNLPIINGEEKYHCLHEKNKYKFSI